MYMDACTHPREWISRLLDDGLLVIILQIEGAYDGPRLLYSDHQET